MIQLIPYTDKIYVSCERGSMWSYFLLMRAWLQSDGSLFNITSMPSSCYDEGAVSNLINDCAVFTLLLGDATKYSAWSLYELKKAIEFNKPVIVLNLNGLRVKDNVRCPIELDKYVSIHIAFASKILQHAVSNWPDFLANRRKVSECGYYFYAADVYKGLGMV